jgi:DNA invertase Pin-like site-specific DNA recombinase
MPVRLKNRGLVYLRRSSGRQETSLETQLEWAIAAAHRAGVLLEASQDDLQLMKIQRLTSYKDIRLDDSITGADLDRPGFRTLNQDALGNRSYSHLFIHKRDRYGRPEDAVDMVSREKKLLLAGITIVYTDSTAEPMERGRQYPERELAMLLGYYESGAFLTKLAERVLEKQRLLALEGFRTGGNAPYGFVRVLVDSQGRVLEELQPGRRVRQSGCHVRLKPGDDTKLKVRLYVLDLKHRGWGFKRIAVQLNQLGIPSPDAGKIRTDNGVPHLVTGKWSHGTVREICTAPINIGLQQYGRRSEGAHRRLGDEGPRLLTDADRNAHDQPRTVWNDKAATITAVSGLEPIFDATRFAEMKRDIEARGKIQRGIPRTKDPARYPLSCRIADLTDGCGAVMYGRMHGQRPIYVCGRYMRTQAAECNNNAVDGEAMLRFTLNTLRQLVDRNGNREKLQKLLLARAQQDSQAPRLSPGEEEIQVRMAMVRELKEQLNIVGRRMAVEKDDARYATIAGEFDRLRGELKSAEKDLEAAQRSCHPVATRTTEGEVNAAMALLDDICRITSEAGARAQINLLLRQLGVWIGLNFGSAIKGKTRVVQRVLGGVMTFGHRGLSVPLYGPDNREGPASDCNHREKTDPDEKKPGLGTSEPVIERVDGRGETETAGRSAEAQIPADSRLERRARPSLGQPEGISFTKGSRGDWIRTSDLLNPIEPGLPTQLN